MEYAYVAGEAFAVGSSFVGLGVGARQAYKDYRNRGKNMYSRKRGPPTMIPTSPMKRMRGSSNVSTVQARGRTRYHHNLGRRPGFMTSKRDSRKSGVEDEREEKKIHVERLVNIQYSDADTDMTKREHRMVNVRGVALRKFFVIKPAFDFNRPITVRWAVLNPKENSGQVADINNIDFFMSKNPTTEETGDFLDGQNLTVNMDWFDAMTRPINKRKYGVLREGYFTLSPDSAGLIDRKNPKQQKYLKLYLPIHKQMKWASNSTTLEAGFPEANLFFVYWYCFKGDLDASATGYTMDAKATIPFETKHEITTYFRTAAPHI